MPSTPGCGSNAAEDDEVRTTLFTDDSAAACRTASVAETTLGMTFLASGSNETSVACVSLVGCFNEVGAENDRCSGRGIPMNHCTYHMRDTTNIPQGPN